MRKAEILFKGQPAGILAELDDRRSYRFSYLDGYCGEPISLTMPIRDKEFTFDRFPPFFEGLLPEGLMLEGLLQQRKIDKNDYLSQIIAVGEDLVGAVTVREIIT